MAGGQGERMGGKIPKQYLTLDGRPVILHTMDKFFQFDPGIRMVLVMAPGHMKFWEAISGSLHQGPEIVIAPGGRTRYESVKNGLKFVGNDLIVGIHDAVRPLVSLETLERCYASAAENGSGIPVTEMDETVRMIGDKGRSVHMDRSLLRRVQTPQVFQSGLIKEAYRQPIQASFTDDASVFESCFEKVFLVEGNRENIKITTATDLRLASLLIRTSE